jgi:ParB family transcriptional regulator, chromosome partitioning protein
MPRKPPPLTPPRLAPPTSGAAPNATPSSSPRAGTFGFDPSPEGPLREVAVDRVEPNRRQPRRIFDEAQLQQLADSIATVGLMSPPLVRETGEQRYELIAGERRWRACQRLGMATLPVLVQDSATDADALAMAVAENIARHGLNPVEEAHAFAALLEEFHLTQDELGRRVGKSQEDISNSIRLLNLPDQVLVLLERRELTKAHGKVLLSEPDHSRRTLLARRGVAESWSVRELRGAVSAAKRRPRSPRSRLDPDMITAADRWTEGLRASTGQPLTVRATAKGFHIEVGDHDTARSLLKRLGVADRRLDEQ